MREGLRLLEAREKKLARLREKIAASIAERGSSMSQEMLEMTRAHLAASKPRQN